MYNNPSGSRPEKNTDGIVIQMKYCVNSYSFGRYGAELGIYGMIEKAAELGFDGFEYVESGWMDVPDAELKKIAEAVRTAGLEPVNLCVGADLINGSGGDLGSEVARVCRLVDKAALLGAPVMRHDVTSGVRGRKHGIGYQSVLPRLAEGCGRITEYAASVGLRTMTENHGFYSQDADRVASLIDAVDHDNFGVLLDLGNFMCADERPEISSSKLAPYAFHVHAKDFLFKPGTEPSPGDGWFRTRGGNWLRGTVIGHGAASIFQSVGMLKRSGYDGWLSVEFEGMEDNLDGIRLGLDNLRRFWSLA